MSDSGSTHRLSYLKPQILESTKNKGEITLKNKISTKKKDKKEKPIQKQKQQPIIEINKLKLKNEL